LVWLRRGLGGASGAADRILRPLLGGDDGHAGAQRGGRGCREAICVGDGSYGELELEASAGRPGVTVRAEHPGKATIAGALLAGSHIVLSHFDIQGEVEIEPGSVGMVVRHNRIHGGYFGVDAGPTTTTTVNDVSIVGNRFVGPFGEDDSLEPLPRRQRGRCGGDGRR
jgi:hypothetical protein